MSVYNPTFTHQTATFHCDSRADFRAALKELRTEGYTNKLHLHEQPFADNHPHAHTLADCEQANRADITLSNPRLFQGTYTHEGQLWIAWGFVAFESKG